jgi:ABC-type branched-subunit amino acid transport system substrate-binding protein
MEAPPHLGALTGARSAAALALVLALAVPLPGAAPLAAQEPATAPSAGASGTAASGTAGAEGAQGAEGDEGGGSEGLSPTEQRGKAIYLRGESPGGGEVTALMGVASVEIPAAALPCGNCHGLDGKGKPEGGVEPSNLTWDALTKPYGVRHASGREHPPYTPRLLKRAISMGIDPAGNELHVAMPRYRMSLEDMDALITYIRRLGTDPEPGVGDDILHLGTLLPPPGRAEGVGTAIESVLEAAFDDLNASGGIYHRRVVLHSHRLPEDPAAWTADVESFLENEEVFALVGAFVAGADAEIPALLAELDVPLVGPFTLHPQVGFPLNRQVFYLLSGLPSQARVLADFAGRRHSAAAPQGSPKPPAALVVGAGEAFAETADAAEEQLEKNGWENVSRHPVEPGHLDAAKLAQDLAQAGVEVVFLLDPEVLGSSFLAAADHLGWHPEIYAPGVFAGEPLLQAPVGFQGKILLSFPLLPGDQSSRGIERYRKLAAEHGLTTASITTQLSTLAWVVVLEYGLKRAGRDLSRSKLIESLEGLYDHPTGLVPPVTYGPNRRIGALGAYVVGLDLETHRFEPQGGWQTPR